MSNLNRGIKSPINDTIILFGAGAIGNALVPHLIRNNIHIQEIWDNKSTQSEICGIMVKKPNNEHNTDISIILATDTPKYLAEMTEQVQKLGFQKIIAFYDYLSAKKWPWEDYRYLIQYIKKAEGLRVCENLEAPIHLETIDIPITEKCSLRCRECSNLMQYFSNPKDQDVEELLLDIDRVLSVVDHVDDARILGGEPFVSPNLCCYVEKMLDYKNVGMVSIFTNGTIVPTGKNLDCLKNERVKVRISDYGPVSRHLQDLEQVCRRYGILYEIIPYSKWTKCARFDRQNRSANENKQILMQCCANTLFTIRNHRLFRCPFLASAWSLQSIPFEAVEFVQIADQSKQKLRKEISEYINRDYEKACEYCPGRPLKGGDEIIAAEQSDHPLSYKKYNYSGEQA